MEDDFASGPWTGFYSYSDRRRERMDLSITFRAGRLSGPSPRRSGRGYGRAGGTGTDPVGPFTLLGGYDPEKNEVYWTKSYETHDVFYTGFRDNRGIWGTWEIASWSSGGFHIWPKGEGPVLKEEAEAEVGEPARRPQS